MTLLRHSLARLFGKGAVAVAAVGLVSTPVDRRQLAVETLRQELDAIDRELKDWWLTRKVALERHRSLHAMLMRHNFVGLSVNSAELPDAQRALWTDLVAGHPKLEDSLSVDAREMKADLYMKMLREAADLESPVYAPGIVYLRCLKDNRTDTHANRSEVCQSKFEAFDSARRTLLTQQENATERAMVQQNISDLRAKSLFERRLHVLSLLESATAATAAAATAAAATAAASSSSRSSTGQFSGCWCRLCCSGRFGRSSRGCHSGLPCTAATAAAAGVLPLLLLLDVASWGALSATSRTALWALSMCRRRQSCMLLLLLQQQQQLPLWRGREPYCCSFPEGPLLSSASGRQLQLQQQQQQQLLLYDERQEYQVQSRRARPQPGLPIAAGVSAAVALSEKSVGSCLVIGCSRNGIQQQRLTCAAAAEALLQAGGRLVSAPLSAEGALRQQLSAARGWSSRPPLLHQTFLTQPVASDSGADTGAAEDAPAAGYAPASPLLFMCCIGRNDTGDGVLCSSSSLPAASPLLLSIDAANTCCLFSLSGRLELQPKLRRCLRLTPLMSRNTPPWGLPLHQHVSRCWTSTVMRIHSSSSSYGGSSMTSSKLLAGQQARPALHPYLAESGASSPAVVALYDVQHEVCWDGDDSSSCSSCSSCSGCSSRSSSSETHLPEVLRPQNELELPRSSGSFVVDLSPLDGSALLLQQQQQHQQQYGVLVSSGAVCIVDAHRMQCINRMDLPRSLSASTASTTVATPAATPAAAAATTAAPGSWARRLLPLSRATQVVVLPRELRIADARIPNLIRAASLQPQPEQHYPASLEEELVVAADIIGETLAGLSERGTVLLLDLRNSSRMRCLAAPPVQSLRTARGDGSLAPSFYYPPGPYSAIPPSVLTLRKFRSDSRSGSSTSSPASCSTADTGGEIHPTPIPSYRAALESSAVTAGAAAARAAAASKRSQLQKGAVSGSAALQCLLQQQQQSVALQRGICVSSAGIRSLQSPGRRHVSEVGADGVVHFWHWGASRPWLSWVVEAADCPSPATPGYGACKAFSCRVAAASVGSPADAGSEQGRRSGVGRGGEGLYFPRHACASVDATDAATAAAAAATDAATRRPCTTRAAAATASQRNRPVRTAHFVS
ncbi:uncharacterized protein LOC34621849 [Cyclospora cayetanensis]|uniref:Uncharacterized protein LOC34621849 n=1 Tax=Cyclospora cayetanensis TaxID=88456 RepID=A0A6P6RZK1_9EIME|nr:uncharacterized protein LOC34621849 [Cyclospora cayetanensis]